MSNSASKIWAICRSRLVPAGTWQVWSVCLILVDLWAFLNILHEVPALRLRLSTWDMIGTIAYILSFGLVESVLFLLIILAAAAVLPARWLSERFAVQGSMVALISAAWAVATLYSSNPVASWDTLRSVLWCVLYLGVVTGVLAIMRRYQPLEVWLQKLVSGLGVLAVLYGGVSAISVVIVIFRNI